MEQTTDSQLEDRLAHQEWLEKRSKGVGASEVAAVIGADGYLSKLELWERKTGRIPEPDLSDKESVELGKKLEPVVAEIFEERTGNTTKDLGRHHMIYSKERPHVFATLDREIEPSDDQGPGCLEIKTTTEYLKDEWEEHATARASVQLQMQMYVTGYKWGAVAALVGGNKFRMYPETRDDELIGMLVESVDEFWRDHVKADVQPLADGTDSATQAIMRLFPECEGKTTAQLDAESDEWVEKWREAKMNEKYWKLEAKTYGNHLKQAVGEALHGETPKGIRLRNSLINRKGFSVEPTSYRRLTEVK